MSYFYQCPRCGEKSIEKLETYSHCVNCLYFKDYWISPDADAFETQKTVRELIKAIDNNIYIDV